MINRRKTEDSEEESLNIDMLNNRNEEEFKQMYDKIEVAAIIAVTAVFKFQGDRHRSRDI